MNKRLHSALLGALVGVATGLAGFAIAQIVPALPFTLQNNTTADATQVMANFNQLLNSVNANGAKNGANSDITSLTGLTTPLAPGVGGTTTFTGGSSTGTANAHVVGTVVPSTFTLVQGSKVVFFAGGGLSNTDATTLNVAATGVRSIFRQTTLGPKALVGGEITAGQLVEVTYDGAQYQMFNAPVLVGDIRDYVGVALPPGWGLADGQCMSQVGQGAALFIVTSTSWGSCSAGNFARPDARGRMLTGRDNMTTAANRITSGGGSCDGATLAVGCGSQSLTIAQSQLPNVSLATSVGAGQGGHTHTVNNPANNFMVFQGGGGGDLGTISGAAFNITSSNLTNTATLPAMTGTTALGGSGVPFIPLNPLIIVNKIVKY